jgi:hypothetical protein
MHTKFSSQNPKRIDNFRDKCGRILLKLISKKQDTRLLFRFSRLRVGSSGGFLSTL